MRTIKFRAKTLDGIWFKWELLDLIDMATLGIDDTTVGEGTGLFDKNGKEIYESDYCMVGDVKVEIIFVDGAFGFDNPSNPGILALLPQFSLEIIGNKYELN